MKKLVIFDLDGTLLNTIEDLGRAANHALSVNGFATHSIASIHFLWEMACASCLNVSCPKISKKTQ